MCEAKDDTFFFVKFPSSDKLLNSKFNKKLLCCFNAESYFTFSISFAKLIDKNYA